MSDFLASNADLHAWVLVEGFDCMAAEMTLIGSLVKAMLNTTFHCAMETVFASLASDTHPLCRESGPRPSPHILFQSPQKRLRLPPQINVAG